METEDIFDGVGGAIVDNALAGIAECALNLLTSTTLTIISNLFSSKIEELNGKLISIDSQIADAQAEISILDTDLAGAITNEIGSLNTLFDKFASPFKLATVDIACIGKIPDLGALIGLPEINFDGGFMSDLGAALLALANLAILEALKAFLITLLLKLITDQRAISDTLSDRANGTAPEPEIDFDNPAISEYINTGIDDAARLQLERTREYIENTIVSPFLESQAAEAAVKAQLAAKSQKELDEIFDLVFGPPISTHGQYILSEDGLYYDSRHGGVPEVMAQHVLSTNWNLDYAPNKGGKGFQLDDSLKDFSNTVFSEDYKETNSMVDFFYDNDNILQAFLNDKAKQTYDVSGQIRQLIDGGYDASSAILQNYYHTIGGLAAAYDNKIRIRRKQLQIAGLFGPFTITDTNFPWGAGFIFQKFESSTDTDAFPPGWFVDDADNSATFNSGGSVAIGAILEEVPVNDFSWLRGSGLVPDLGIQRKYLIQSEDVDDVVLPLKARFLEADKISTIYVRDFNVSPEATTDWPAALGAAASGYGEVSSTLPFIKGLDEGIATDDLLICYNFLRGATLPASSTEYNLDNSAESYTHFDGKLVADSASSVFVSGLAIPKLSGVLYNPGRLYTPEPWYNGMPGGSYVRLPNNIKDGELNISNQKLDNLGYSPTGFSIDFWTYVPGLHSELTRAHRYRVVFGCENTGLGSQDSSQPITANPNTVDNRGLVTDVRDMNKTHGLIMGFRDKSYSDAAAGQEVATNLEFFVLPTVSQNDPTGKFGDSTCIAEKLNNAYSPDAGTEIGFTVGIGAQNDRGDTIKDVSSGFHHMAVSVDYNRDLIELFMDGQRLGSAKVSTSFLLPPGQPLNVPSPVSVGDSPKQSSLGVASGLSHLTYNTESVHQGTTEIPPVPMLTPWIIGGGFTDTAPRQYTLEQQLGFQTTPVGFLGTNTNSSYYDTRETAIGNYAGQHTPALGGEPYTGITRKIPSSGYEGFVGSFKIYTKSLSINEAKTNFDAQKSFFQTILI